MKIKTWMTQYGKVEVRRRTHFCTLRPHTRLHVHTKRRGEENLFQIGIALHFIVAVVGVKRQFLFVGHWSQSADKALSSF